MFLFFNSKKHKTQDKTKQKLTRKQKTKSIKKTANTYSDKKDIKHKKEKNIKNQDKQKKVVKTTPRYEFLYKALRSARIRANLTQIELAQKSKIARSTIARIESGEWNTEVETLMRLAEAMDMKLVIFFEQKK